MITPQNRYEEEWVGAFWAAQWQSVALRLSGTSDTDPRMERVRNHYFPLFDAAYSERNPQKWAEIMRNFQVGFPLPPNFKEFKVQEPPKKKVEPAPIVDEIELWTK
jgi:hypothetical protein